MEHKKYKWTQNNSVILLEDSINWLPAMKLAINNAEKFIFIELYLVESGKVLDEIIEVILSATTRGIKIYMILDGYGASKISRKNLNELSHTSIYLKWFNPLKFSKLSTNLVRNHRKLVLIDDAMAFVGGFGFTDDYAYGDKPWCDVAILIKGASVLHWHNLFAHTWKSSNVEKTKKTTLPEIKNQQILEGDLNGRLVYAQGLYLQKVKISLLTQIRKAKLKVWITTPYFVPALKVRLALQKAAARGVDVRLLLPGKNHDHPMVRYAGQRFYNNLLKSGVRIYEYQPRFIHAKVSMCDIWTSIGSCNFDHWGLTWNLEANQEFYDSAFAATIENWFEKSFFESKEITYENWSKRSKWQRVREYFASLLNSMSQRLR